MVRSASVVFLLIKQFRGRACSIIKTFFLNASFHRVAQKYTDECRSSDFNWKNSDQRSKDAGHSSPDRVKWLEWVLGAGSTAETRKALSRRGTCEQQAGAGRETLGLHTSADQESRCTHFGRC